MHVGIAALAGVTAAALFIHPLWALPAGAVAALAVALGRSRVAGLAGLAVAVFVGASAAYSVWRDDPFPSGLWLRTVEHLHLVGLLAIVLVFMSSVLPDDAAPVSRRAPSPSG